MTVNDVEWSRAREIYARIAKLRPSEREERIAAIVDESLRRRVLRLLTVGGEATRVDASCEGGLEGLLAAGRQFSREDASLGDNAQRPETVHFDAEPAEGLVGAYRILGRLGRGGMGDVLLGERADGLFDQRVAIKLLRRGLDSEDVLERFSRERQILARLQHPHIAKLFDGGATPDGRPYFVMELVDGEPITSYCRSRDLTVDDRLRLLIECCGAVAAAHRNLVIHRDLKPSNVLVNRDGDVKLLDFGIAKVIGPDPTNLSGSVTQTQVRIFTPDYAAPEQELGQPVTTATDVWALGGLLYELLTGTRPRIRSGPATDVLGVSSPTGDVEKASARVAREPLEWIPWKTVSEPERRRLQRRLLGDLDNILAMALRDEPERRYASAAALGEDLRRHRDHRPVDARPDTLAYRAGKFVRRHRAGVAAACLSVLALVGGLVGTTWQARRAERSAREAAAQARRAGKVQDLMVQIFQGSDPVTTGRRDANATEVIERGIRRVESELSAEPDVQAALYDAVAQVELNLGEIARGQALAERAVMTRVRTLGANHPLTARSRVTLASAQALCGDLFDAELELVRALPVLTATYGPDATETIGAANELQGVLDSGHGERETQLAIAEYVARITSHRYGDQAHETGLALENLGLAQCQADDYAQGETNLRLALGIFERTNRVDAATARLNLGEALVYLGRHGEARAEYERALPTLRETYGDRHPQVGSCLISIAYLLQQEGRYDEADRATNEALGIYRAIDHLDTGWCLRLLGISELRREHWPQAASLLQQAVDVYRRKVGEDEPLTLAVTIDLARTDVGRDRLESAEARTRPVLTKLEKLIGPDNGDLWTALTVLGEVRRKRGDVEEAIGLHRRALNIMLKSSGPGNRTIGTIGYQLALDLLARGRPDDLAESRTLLDQAIDLQRRLSPDHLDLDLYLASRGRVARAQEDIPSAQRDFQESVERMRRHHGESHPLTREALRDLAALR